jgi:hypothetical protein
MPSITAAKISPSGNVLVLETDSAVTGVNPGIALLCNGITTSMANPVYQGEYPWCWFPLSEQKFAIVDDSDAAFTATGPGWSSMPVADTGQGVARFEAIHVTAGASDTATYHFSGLIPGTYRISAILGQLYGPDRTTHASYTVRDGSNVLATVAIDQTKEPSFDWAAGYRFMDLCGPAQPVTITGTTLTVTVANAAGSGLLVTDAIAVDYLCGRAAPLGASITLSAPAGAIQTAAGPTAAVANLPVTLATDADWMPFDRTAKHTMQVGYNKNRPGAGEVSLFYANRARERDAWQPAGGNDQISVDAHGELTAVIRPRDLGADRVRVHWRRTLATADGQAAAHVHRRVQVCGQRYTRRHAGRRRRGLWNRAKVPQLRCGLGSVDSHTDGESVNLCPAPLPAFVTHDRAPHGLGHHECRLV